MGLVSPWVGVSHQTVRTKVAAMAIWIEMTVLKNDYSPDISTVSQFYFIVLEIRYIRAFRDTGGKD